MPKKSGKSMYLVGTANEDGRSHSGKYYAIRGEQANKRGHIEWQPVQFLDSSKWYGVRVGPTERHTRNTNIVAHPLCECSTKGEVVDKLNNMVNFDEVY